MKKKEKKNAGSMRRLPLAELYPELGQVELIGAGAAAAAALAGPPAISQGRQLDRSLLRLVHKLRMGNL